MTRPSREETCMAHARVVALRSTCSRANVGAVFALDGRPLVSGYNGAPAGMPHCSHECDCEASREDGLAGHDLLCMATSPCTIAVHAEANAVAWAARHGIRLEGSDLYTTYTPCLACAQLLVNVGVARVWALQLYRDPAGQRLLEQAGVEVVDWASAQR